MAGEDDDSSSFSIGEEEQDDDVPTEQRQVEQWTRQIPIGLGICPWAAKSYTQGLLRYVTCRSETPHDVALCVQREIHRVCTTHHHEQQTPWRTTLVICPYVREWNKSFPVFDEFVSQEIWDQFGQEEDGNPSTEHIKDQITLVSFHPNFLRWYGLPDNITVGSIVQSHYGMIGKKSLETAPATIIETDTKPFGMRRVKVRFHIDEKVRNAKACDNARRQDQYVPTNWIRKITPNNYDDNQGKESGRALPLPDNAMHQAPYPTIHIINNADLATLSIRDISRVKRKNAQRMMKLGWDGIELKKRSLTSSHK
jgi:hypothetical protein